MAATLPTPEQIAERLGGKKVEEGVPVASSEVKTVENEAGGGENGSKDNGSANGENGAVKDVAEKAAEQETIFLENFNKQFGTTYENPAAIEAIIASSKGLSDLQPKYEDLNTRFNALELKSQVDPFADAVVKGLNDLKKSGASIEKQQAYMFINSMDLDSMGIEEKTLLTYRLRDGLTPQEAAIAFVDEYAIAESDYEINEDDEDVEAQKVKIRKQIQSENIRLKRDATVVNEYLNGYKKEASTVENPEDVFTKKWNEYEPSVKEIPLSIQSNYKGAQGVALNVVKEGDPERFDFEMPDDFKKEIPRLVGDFIKQEFAAGRPLTMNDAGVTQINKHLDKIMWSVYGPKYVMDAGIHMYSKATEDMANKNSNSAEPIRGDIKPEAGKGVQNSVEKYKSGMLNKY